MANGVLMARKHFPRLKLCWPWHKKPDRGRRGLFPRCRHHWNTSLWLAGNEGMEKRKETLIL